jgi:methionyl-tRNA formyltransferase
MIEINTKMDKGTIVQQNKNNIKNTKKYIH